MNEENKVQEMEFMSKLELQREINKLKKALDTHCNCDLTTRISQLEIDKERVSKAFKKVIGEII